MPALNRGLRNFLITGGYSPAIIDFYRSVINEKERYQVLALKKPHQMAFVIQDLKWPFSKDSHYGLLIFDTETQKVTAEIDLKISFDFTGLERTFDKELSFSFIDGKFLLKGEHIMVVEDGWIYGKSSDPSRCTNVAVFHITGKLVHAWKLGFYQDKLSLRDFTQIQGNRWFVKLETSDWHYLYMLVPDRVEGFVIVAQKQPRHTTTGSILDTKTHEIKYWFSDEEGRPAVFVLAGSYQLQVYRHNNQYGYDKYEKLVDATINNSYIGELSAELKNDNIIVSFTNNQALLRSGKLIFSLVTDGS